MTRAQMLRKVTYYDPEIGKRLKQSNAPIKQIQAWLPNPDTYEYEKEYGIPFKAEGKVLDRYQKL